MSDTYISQLQPCNPLSGNGLVPIIQKDPNNKNIPSLLTTRVSFIADFFRDYIIPPGTIWVYAAPVDGKDLLPPKGWLLCNGATHPVASYPRLYKVLGNLYGMPATPGTIFKVPDLRGRFVLGFSSLNRAIVPNFGSFLGQAITMPSVGGEYNHVLTEAEMPRHTHILYDRTPRRSHLSYPDYKRVSPEAGTVTGAVEQQQGRSVGFFQSGKNGKRDGDGSDLAYIELGGINSKESGQTQAHPNIPPHICLNHIIKY